MDFREGHQAPARWFASLDAGVRRLVEVGWADRLAALEEAIRALSPRT